MDPIEYLLSLNCEPVAQFLVYHLDYDELCVYLERLLKYDLLEYCAMYGVALPWHLIAENSYLIKKFPSRMFVVSRRDYDALISVCDYIDGIKVTRELYEEVTGFVAPLYLNWVPILKIERILSTEPILINFSMLTKNELVQSIKYRFTNKNVKKIIQYRHENNQLKWTEPLIICKLQPPARFGKIVEICWNLYEEGYSPSIFERVITDKYTILDFYRFVRDLRLEGLKL